MDTGIFGKFITGDWLAIPADSVIESPPKRRTTRQIAKDKIKENVRNNSKPDQYKKYIKNRYGKK